MNPFTKWIGGGALMGVLGAAALSASAPYEVKAQNASAPQAPELVGKRWFNTNGGKPLTSPRAGVK
jgi:hypothetical protein